MRTEPAPSEMTRLQVERLKEIESRAHAINLTMPRLCELAGANPQQVRRWHTGRIVALYPTFTSVTGKLTETLDELEREIYRQLHTRHGRQCNGH